MASSDIKELLSAYTSLHSLAQQGESAFLLLADVLKRVLDTSPRDGTFGQLWKNRPALRFLLSSALTNAPSSLGVAFGTESPAGGSSGATTPSAGGGTTGGGDSLWSLQQVTRSCGIMSDISMLCSHAPLLQTMRALTTFRISAQAVTEPVAEQLVQGIAALAQDMDDSVRNVVAGSQLLSVAARIIVRHPRLPDAARAKAKLPTVRVNAALLLARSAGISAQATEQLTAFANVCAARAVMQRFHGIVRGPGWLHNGMQHAHRTDFYTRLTTGSILVLSCLPTE